MRRATLMALAGAALLIAAPPAGASVFTDIPPHRDTSGFTQVGTTYNEGVGGIAQYQWGVDRRAAEAVLEGFDQTDTLTAAPTTEIDCSPTDPAGEIGRDVAQIAFLPNQSKLLVADNTNSRVLVYDRSDNGVPGEDPANCATGAAITSISGLAFSQVKGLAVNASTGEAYVAAYFDDGVNPPANGIMRFDPVSQSMVNLASGFPAGDPAALAVNGNNGYVFAAIQGTGTIQALKADPSTAATDPEGADIPAMSSGTPGDFTSLAAEPNTNRLYALKPDEVDVFSMTTGTLLGTVSGFSWGGENLSIAPIENYQGLSISSSGTIGLRNLWANPNPVCTPGAAIDVNAGASVTFTPSCTDDDGSAVREFSVVGAQSLGTAVVVNNRTQIRYDAGAAQGGQDFVTYRVQTQDGLSVQKSQAINVVKAAGAIPPAEQPVVRESTNLQLDSGDVYVKLPGSGEFVKLTKDMLVPVGTIIDATSGRAHLTMANQDGSTYDGVFWDGIFQVLQGGGAFPYTTMKLRNDLVGKTAAARLVRASSTAELADAFKAFTARRRGKKKNGLWGNAKGRFRTSGKGGSAAVRGTIWYVADYTHGSLFKVRRGKVLVDPKRGRNFYLAAGKQKFVWSRP